MADAHELRGLAGRTRAILTPHPHRGDLIAAGAVPLALGVLLLNVRMGATWGVGVFLVLNALACGLILGMGLLAPLEGEQPRSYQQVLLLAGLLLGFITLVRLAQVLGVHGPLTKAGTDTWIFLIVTVGSVWIARTRRSAVCALIAALAGVGLVLSFVQWVFSPTGIETARCLLLVSAVVLVLGALMRRDRQRRESVYLIDAAGVAIVVLGLTFVGALLGVLTFVGAPAGAPGSGWKLVLLAAGLGLVAYAGVDEESGPAYLGALILLLFALLAGLPGAGGASVWFWPLALLLIGAVAVGAGLRPRRELPPEPPAPGARPGDPPTEPLPGPGAARGGLWARSARERDDGGA